MKGVVQWAWGGSRPREEECQRGSLRHSRQRSRGRREGRKGVNNEGGRQSAGPESVLPRQEKRRGVVSRRASRCVAAAPGRLRLSPRLKGFARLPRNCAPATRTVARSADNAVSLRERRFCLAFGRYASGAVAVFRRRWIACRRQRGGSAQRTNATLRENARQQPPTGSRRAIRRESHSPVRRQPGRRMSEDDAAPRFRAQSPNATRNGSGDARCAVIFPVLQVHSRRHVFPNKEGDAAAQPLSA